MAAVRHSPNAICQSLVRLGHLCFDDFLLLKPETLDIGHWTSDVVSDWAIALNNAPGLFLHLHRLFPDSSFILQPSSPADTAAAQSRLVHAFAYQLLRAKAPPLCDALPWQDWDFSIVARRFKLWQTRFLLAGDGTMVAMYRCRKSAGVYVVEPDETIARYVERKAVLEKIRRFKLLRASLERIPLPDRSTDLAIVGSILEKLSPPALAELARVAANVLLVENSPLSPPLDEAPVTAAGFRPDTVAVSALGPRRCWWKRV
ncbi:MAG TPA: class I SAM-dependent methyltransferase [bacterium]|nr:class I SAM-dependent methyltransferase [bacterium]